MRRANVVGGKERQKRFSLQRSLDRDPAVSFSSLDQTGSSKNVKPGRARDLNRLDGRSSGCTNAVHDDDTGAFLKEALDPLARSMRFLALTHQETMDELLYRLAGCMLVHALCACDCDCRHNRVSSHGQPTGRGRNEAVLFEQFQQRQSGEAATFRV